MWKKFIKKVNNNVLYYTYINTNTINKINDSKIRGR